MFEYIVLGWLQILQQEKINDRGKACSLKFAIVKLLNASVTFFINIRPFFTKTFVGRLPLLPTHLVCATGKNALSE